jgi:hypothetical protein
MIQFRWDWSKTGEFFPKKRSSQKQRKLLCRNVLVVKMPHDVLVLTEKQAIFEAFWQLNRCFWKQKTSLFLIFGVFSRF